MEEAVTTLVRNAMDEPFQWFYWYGAEDEARDLETALNDRVTWDDAAKFDYHIRVNNLDGETGMMGVYIRAVTRYR